MPDRLKIYLHAGMHKTGTKALQRLLYSKRRKLRRYGFFYPDIGSYHHNSILNLRSSSWSSEFLLEQLNIARKQSASVVIFSAEVLSILSENEIKRLRYYLGDNEIVFVFVFRHWCNYLPSRWAQNCLVRDAQTFDEYLNKLKDPAYTHIDIGFDFILKRFQENSDAKIKAVSYSNSMILKGSVLVDIFKAFEFSDKLSHNLLRKERHVNVRPNWVRIEQTRLLNAALSEHFLLNKNDLFQSIGEFGIGNIAYKLQLEHFEPDVLDYLSDIIRKNKKTIHLSSTDNWINNLNNRFQSTSSDYFINLHRKSIFYGEFNKEVKYTSLYLQDIYEIDLKEVVQHLNLNDF